MARRMSANPLQAIAGLIVLATGTAAFANDDELPDADFLEYLGSWEDSDEEWLIFEDGDQLARAESGNETDDDGSKGDDNES